MKPHLRLLTALLLGLALSTTHAQPGPRGRSPGGPPTGPQFGGSLAKIFGEHSAFFANTKMQVTGGSPQEEMIVPGKLAYLDGKSRFEMNMSKMKSKQLPADAAAQMKEMGMDQMIAIGRPDKKVTYLIYSGLESYVENPLTDPSGAKPKDDFKMEITELGKDTVDGHACIKNKVVVTDPDGKTQESTVWNATDLKKFPVKIETKDHESTTILTFKDVKFSRPEDAQFEPPAKFKKYASMMGMMQEQMMKRMGGGFGAPPPGE